MSWKVYQNMPDNFTDNPLAGFVQYRKANEARGNASNGSPYPAYTIADDVISPLIKGIGNTMPDGGFLQALKDDIAAGQPAAGRPGSSRRRPTPSTRGLPARCRAPGTRRKCSMR
ncbi:hypothetical protein ACU4GD_08010 [Cupriavidus basilensis]